MGGTSLHNADLEETAHLKTSLGIWALGPMVTRFVPGGYQPEHRNEPIAEKVHRSSKRRFRPRSLSKRHFRPPDSTWPGTSAPPRNRSPRQRR